VSKEDSEKKGDKPSTESIVVNALQIEGIDLEPTEDELNFFLTHESTIGVDDIAQTAKERSPQLGNASTDIEKAYEEVVAMNRKNATNSFSKQTEAAIARKRQQLLEELEKRHENSE
jgi:hypothetical protein